MKRNLTILIIAGIIITITCGLVFAQPKYEGEDLAKQIGAGLKNAVQTLILDEKESSTEKISPFTATSSKDTVAVIMGEPISKDYFNMRAELYEVCGSENVAIDAWNAIKIEVYERNFAREHNLIPTEAEISAYSADMRKRAESTEESHAVLSSLLSGLGMTEDMYWNEYQPEYEAPLQLIKANVAYYKEKHNMRPTDASEIEGEILDQAYFDNL